MGKQGQLLALSAASCAAAGSLTLGCDPGLAHALGFKGVRADGHGDEKHEQSAIRDCRLREDIKYSILMIIFITFLKDDGNCEYCCADTIWRQAGAPMRLAVQE